MYCIYYQDIMLFLASIVFCQKYNMSNMLPQHDRQFFSQILILHSRHTVWHTVV